MKRSNDSQRKGGRTLPDFLSAEAPAGDETTSATSLDAEAAVEAPTDELVDEPDEPHDEEQFAEHEQHEPFGEEEHDGEPAEHDEPPPTARSARSRRHQDAAAAPSGGVVGTLLGTLAGAVGVAAPFVPALGDALARAGLGNGTLLLLGTAVFVGARLSRRVGEARNELAHERALRQDADEALLTNVQQLLDANPATHAPGGDVEQVLLALQRQDEKVNNLTKAIKMYGKPLMEIASQSTELAGGLSQLRTLVDGNAEVLRQGFTRMEKEVGRAGSGAAKLDLGQMPQQVARLEVGLAAIAQRLEDSEVRRTLVRLEDATREARGELQQLLRGDTVKTAATSLQQRLDAATKGLADGLQQLRDGNLGGLEQVAREIQREVSGVATAVAQIQAAVRQGARAAAAPAPAPAAAQPAAATPAAVAPASTPTSAPAAAPAPAPAAAAAAKDGDESGATGYQTGKRTSGGKNVLGAIAKLKQMKS